jgi:anti-sigma B factor antagonist
LLGADGLGFRLLASSGMRDEPFQVLSSSRDDSVIVEVRGEIDLATAPELMRGVEAGLDAGPSGVRRLVIDLSDVGFLDSSGLNTLVRLRRLLDGRGIAFRLVSPADRAVRQVFEITELTKPLHVVDSLDDALD